MSNFSSLKAAIQQYIKTNGNEEITGAVLQDILLSMVSVLGDTAINDLETALQTETTNRSNADGTLQQNITAEGNARQQADTALGGRIDGLQSTVQSISTMLGEGYLYAGLATTSTNPGTPTGKVFYIATAAGTYTNFLDSNSSAIVLTKGINIIKFNGTFWFQERIYKISETPALRDSGLVESTGVASSDLSISKNLNNLGDCRVVTVKAGYIDYETGMLKQADVQHSIMLFDVEGLTNIILQAFNSSMSAKYYGFYNDIEYDTASVDGKHDYVYGFNVLTVPSGAKYLGIISEFNGVGSTDMFRVLSLQIDIKQPTSNIQKRMSMLPLLAVCPNMYVENGTGVFLCAGTPNNNIESCIYDVTGISRICISVPDGFTLSTPYFSFYASITDLAPIDGQHFYGKNRDMFFDVPAGAKYLFMMTKWSGNGTYKNVFVTDADSIWNQMKEMLNSGMSIVPMAPKNGMLVKTDTMYGVSSGIKSFVSDWIDVKEGDVFLYLGFGSGSSPTPVQITSNSDGCSWIFAGNNGIVSAYAINNWTGEPYELVIPSGVTKVKFSHISYFNSYRRNLLLKKNTMLDYALLRPWATKTWVCVGDSLTEQNSTSAKFYYQYISELTGINIVNKGKSGSGYKEEEDQNNSIRQRIQTVPASYDVLTIFGSGNDLHSNEQGQQKYTLGDVTDQTTDTICGCINLTLDWLQVNRPLIPVGIITPTPWASYGGAIPSNPDNRMSLYVKKLVEIALRHGVPVLDLYHCSMLHPETSAFRALAYSRDGSYTASSSGVSGAIQVTAEYLDAVRTHGLPNANVGDWVLPSLSGVHPDEHGHKLIAPMIEAFIKKLFLNR